MQGNSAKETNKLCKETTYLPLFPDFSTNKVLSETKSTNLNFPKFFCDHFLQTYFFFRNPLSIEVREIKKFPFIVSMKLRSKFRPSALNLHYVFLNTVFLLSRIWKSSNSTGGSHYSNKILNYILLLSIEGRSDTILSSFR